MPWNITLFFHFIVVSQSKILLPSRKDTSQRFRILLFTRPFFRQDLDSTGDDSDTYTLDFISLDLVVLTPFENLNNSPLSLSLDAGERLWIFKPSTVVPPEIVSKICYSCNQLSCLYQGSNFTIVYNYTISSDSMWNNKKKGIRGEMRLCQWHG